MDRAVRKGPFRMLLAIVWIVITNNNLHCVHDRFVMIQYCIDIDLMIVEVRACRQQKGGRRV